MIHSPGSITIGEQTLLLEKMNLAVGTEVRRWALQKARAERNPFKEIMAKVADLPKEIQTIAFQEAARVTVSSEVSDSEWVAQMSTLEGCQYLVWLLARRQHPDLVLTSVQSLVTSENWLDVFQQIYEISGLRQWSDATKAKYVGAS